MPKRRFSCWLSDAARGKLDDLSERYGTQATVIEVALDRLWLEERGNLRRELPSVGQATGAETEG